MATSNASTDRVTGGPGSAHLEQPARLQRDLELQRVQRVAVARGPAAPDVGRLAQRAVARAGHIAEDAVKVERAMRGLLRLAARSHDGKELALMVGDEQAWAAGT